jgi:hypothetical protein
MTVSMATGGRRTVGLVALGLLVITIAADVAALFVGKNTVRLLSSSMPTTNERFREAFDWEACFPTCRDGLADVVETWNENGMLRNTGAGYEWSGE